MPWEKHFDADEILEVTMELFWERGYQRLSIADLVHETGVSRSSLYATYGNKADLFRQAVERYDRVHRQEWFEELGVRYAPLDSIQHAFNAVAGAPDPARRFGCLLVNTTLDVHPGESDVADLVRAAFGATELFFDRQLRLAKASGQLSAATDTAALAATLMALFLGMRVLARSQRPPDTIASILRQVDTMLQLDTRS